MRGHVNITGDLFLFLIPKLKILTQQVILDIFKMLNFMTFTVVFLLVPLFIFMNFIFTEISSIY